MTRFVVGIVVGFVVGFVATVSILATSSRIPDGARVGSPAGC